MYAKIKNGIIEQYPYTIDNLRQENPQTSFPSNITSELLHHWDVVVVQETAKPSYNEMTQKIVEGVPVKQKARNFDGTWKADNPKTLENEAWEWAQVWNVVSLSTEEVAKIKADKNKKLESMRINAYRDEADPLFFKWQRGEATEQEWRNKVAEIKARFPEV